MIVAAADPVYATAVVYVICWLALATRGEPWRPAVSVRPIQQQERMFT